MQVNTKAVIDLWLLAGHAMQWGGSVHMVRFIRLNMAAMIEKPHLLYQAKVVLLAVSQAMKVDQVDLDLTLGSFTPSYEAMGSILCMHAVYTYM